MKTISLLLAAAVCAPTLSAMQIMSGRRRQQRVPDRLRDAA